VERSDDLFTVPDAQRWFLEAADCTEFARKLSDLRVRSRLRKPDDDLTAEFEELTTEAAAALITPELRKLYRDRVMDLSRALAWRGGMRAAHWPPPWRWTWMQSGRAPRSRFFPEDGRPQPASGGSAAAAWGRPGEAEIPSREAVGAPSLALNGVVQM